MISLIVKEGSSWVLSKIDFNPEDGVDYVKDSISFSFTALYQFPPDVLPLITLFTAVVVTGRGMSKCMQGKVSLINVTLIVGSWSGYYALRENRMGLKLKQTVSDLEEQLEKTEAQIKIWDMLAQQEEGLLIRLKDSSGSMQAAAKELGQVVGILKEALKLQKILLKKQDQLVTKVNEEVAIGHEILKREGEVLKPVEEEIIKGLQDEKRNNDLSINILDAIKIAEDRLGKKIREWEEKRDIPNK